MCGMQRCISHHFHDPVRYILYRFQVHELEYRVPLTSICDAGLAHLADLALLGSPSLRILHGATAEEKVSLCCFACTSL